jgi:hypothetical protein
VHWLKSGAVFKAAFSYGTKWQFTLIKKESCKVALYSGFGHFSILKPSSGSGFKKRLIKTRLFYIQLNHLL